MQHLNLKSSDIQNTSSTASYSGNMNFSSITVRYVALALLSISLTLHAKKYHIKVKNCYTDHPKTITISFLRKNGELFEASPTTIAVGGEAEVTIPSLQRITAAANVIQNDKEIPLGTFYALHHVTAPTFQLSYKDGVLIEYALKADGIELHESSSHLLMCVFQLKHITVVNAYNDHGKVIKIEFLGRNREQIGSPTTVQHGKHADVIIPTKHENSKIIVVVVEKKDDSEDIPLGLFYAFDPRIELVNIDYSIVTVEAVRVKQLEFKFDIRDNNNVVFYNWDKQYSWGKLHQENHK